LGVNKLVYFIISFLKYFPLLDGYAPQVEGFGVMSRK